MLSRSLLLANSGRNLPISQSLIKSTTFLCSSPAKVFRRGSTRIEFGSSSSLSCTIGWNNSLSQRRHQSTLPEEKPSKAALAAKILKETKAEGSSENLPAPEPKKSLWQRIKHELVHYWHGSKLLAKEIRISSRLFWKSTVKGQSLTRREHKQLVRTTADIFRLVPFLVFVIVPFMEFALPLALKLFPNMLPSTFETKYQEEEKRKRLVKVRLEMAKFLQDTISEMAVDGSETKEAQAAREFSDFFKKYRSTGQLAPTEEIVKVARKFDDEVTLNNLSRPQLLSMCRYMNVNAFGTDAFLRYQIRKKMKSIKQDDQMIAAEGIDALDLKELASACSSRGIRTLGNSPARMRSELQQWIDLHLNYQIPPTLLLLSKAFAYGSDVSIAKQTPEEALQAMLQNLPEEVVDETELTVSEATGARPDYKQKLEFLKKQEELIKQELKQEAAAKVSEVVDPEVPTPVKEIIDDARITNTEADPRLPEEQLKALGEALQVMSSPSAFSPELQELEELKKEREDFKEDVEEIQEITEKPVESRASQMLGKRLDKMLAKLDVELETFDKQIGNRLNLIKANEEGIVSVEQLEEALRTIKNHPNDERIKEIVSRLDPDHDGLVFVNEVLEYARKLEQDLEEKEGVGITVDQEIIRPNQTVQP